MGRSWRRAGYGCPPGIATHGPRPQEGAGEERRRRGRGGDAGRSARVSFAAGAGGEGMPKECVAISCRRRRGWGGEAGKTAWVSFAAGAGGVEECCREKRAPAFGSLRPDIDHDRREPDEGDCTDEEGDLSCTEGFTPDVQGGVCPVTPAEHARVGALALLV